MNMNIRILIVGLISLLTVSVTAQTRKINIALLVHSGQNQEVTAIKTILEKGGAYDCTLLPTNQIGNLNHYNVVWFQRVDSTAFLPEELAAKAALSKYVSEGGHLILSMEAVRLLNEWNIEPEAIQTKQFAAVDDGFGRKLGFHAYREHPLFDKMFGGAYTWHGKVDNTCRVLGFFGDSWPKANEAKVSATLWEYIFYHPTDKVVWETTLGKGKILAIGAFLYYNRDNFHSHILRQFTLNCARYMSGALNGKPAYYWTKQQSGIVLDNVAFKPVILSTPFFWNLPHTGMQLSRKASTYCCDLPSQRNLVVAQEKAGIEEIWSHPFMSLRDFHTRIDVEGVDTLIALQSFQPEFQMLPNAFIRTYHIGGLTLKEIVTSDAKRPAVVVHYQWEGTGLKRIVTDFKSNLRYMWPYNELALGPVYYQWSPAMNAFVVTNQKKEFCSLIGSNVKGLPLVTGQFETFSFNKGTTLPQTTSSTKQQVATAISYSVENNKALDLFVVGTSTGLESAKLEYAIAMKQPFDIFTGSASYYQNYLSSVLDITTPDTLLNESYHWAVVSSLQFLVNTPGIGTSLMAGYSSSRRGWGGMHSVSGRPGYAWYFGRDAVWSGFAFDGLGDFKTVKKVLQTMIRFQQVDGKIYHELTSSSSVHFDASDATPLFVTLMAHYVRRSGDVDFVKKNMGAIHKAMDYCYSTDTDGDHLIEISNVGHGWLEGGELYGSHTEFYLSGTWNQALNDAAYLSTLTGDNSLADKYTKESLVVNKILNNDFWNNNGYFNYGKMHDGSFTKDLISLTTVPIYFGVTDSAKAQQTISKLSGPLFSADWGVRMINDDNSLFSPTAYHMGSIWPLFTGWTSLAQYKTGHYNQGFENMMANLESYKDFALGRAPEVINGLVYKPSGVTLHQCWSETMAIQPLVEGLLGINSDAVANRLTLAPRFPFDWKECRVKNIAVGSVKVNFYMQKGENKMTYTFSSNSPIHVDFQPVLPPGATVSEVKVNSKTVYFHVKQGEEYTTLISTFGIEKNAVVEIHYQDAASALPSIIKAQIDQPSSGFKIMKQIRKGNQLEITMEGRPASSHEVQLYLPYGYTGIQGGTEPRQLREKIYTTTVSFKNSPAKYTTETLTVLIK